MWAVFCWSSRTTQRWRHIPIDRAESLNIEVFAQLRVAWDPLEIDLFATTINHRLPKYCSRVEDLAAWALDTFSFHWGHFWGYASLPPPLSSELAGPKKDQGGSGLGSAGGSALAEETKVLSSSVFLEWVAFSSPAEAGPSVPTSDDDPSSTSRGALSSRCREGC